MVRSGGKRLLIIGLVLVGLPIFVLITPVILTLVALFDLLTGYRKLPMARLWLVIVALTANEWFGLLAYVWVRVTRGLRLISGPTRVMSIWSGHLLNVGRVLLGLNLVFPDPITMPPGRLIVLSRHSSAVDAVIPAWLFPGPLRRGAHYVLKQELSWMPAINLFVPLLGNYFVERNADTEHELEKIGQLARDADPESGLIIFPEGTYATEFQRSKIRGSLERREEHDTLELMDRLQYLLPPKPDGALALLANRPDANVIIFGHSGLEPLGTYRSIRSSVPLQSPVQFHWWEVPRDRLPADPDDQVAWLFSEWEQLDCWVASTK